MFRLWNCLLISVIRIYLLNFIGEFPIYSCCFVYWRNDYALSIMLLLTGKSLHVACYLIRVPMMNMREVSWQSWSSNVVVNLLQKWRGWSVLILLHILNQQILCDLYFVCPFQLFQVTDLTLARENQTSFEEYLNNNLSANPGIDLTVTVLTTGFWPSYKSFDLNLPAEMVMLAHIAFKINCKTILEVWHLQWNPVLFQNKILPPLSLFRYYS